MPCIHAIFWPSFLVVTQTSLLLLPHSCAWHAWQADKPCYEVHDGVCTLEATCHKIRCAMPWLVVGAWHLTPRAPHARTPPHRRSDYKPATHAMTMHGRCGGYLRVPAMQALGGRSCMHACRWLLHFQRRTNQMAVMHPVRHCPQNTAPQAMRLQPSIGPVPSNMQGLGSPQMGGRARQTARRKVDQAISAQCTVNFCAPYARDGRAMGPLGRA
jgi:hypothetical protein